MSKKINKKEVAVADTTRKEIKSLIHKQIDGKLHNKKGVSSIDELLGETDASFKDHKTEADYEAYLGTLNQIDLENHAATLMVSPRQDRYGMVKQLLKEYRIRTSRFFNTIQHSFEYPKEISPEVERILSEGK